MESAKSHENLVSLLTAAVSLGGMATSDDDGKASIKVSGVGDGVSAGGRASAGAVSAGGVVSVGGRVAAAVGVASVDEGMMVSVGGVTESGNGVAAGGGRAVAVGSSIGRLAAVSCVGASDSTSSVTASVLSFCLRTLVQTSLLESIAASRRWKMLILMMKKVFTKNVDRKGENQLKERKNWKVQPEE